MKAELQYVYKFEYQATFGELGSENELCWVFVGRSDDAADLNLNEVNELRYISPEALDAEMETNPEKFTPWLKMEWKKLRTQYWHQVEALN